jgi:protease IV
MLTLLALLRNGLLGLSLAVRLPLRLLFRGKLPPYVRFVLKGDPPYRAGFRRGWLRRRPAVAQVAALEDLHRALERLAKDSRVRGIVLEVGPLEMPPAKRLLIAQWLEAFRAAGKEVVGFAVSPGNAEYALLCSASRVVLPRPGRLGLEGFLLEATAIGKALERLGIRAEFVRRGDFKTAPEFFTRSDVSPNQRALIEALLDDRHGELVDAVAAGRRMERGQATARVDQGPYSAERAQAAGLVDALADEAELPGLLGLPPVLHGDVHVPAYSAYLAALRRPAVRWAKVRSMPRLAVVPLSGMIADGEGNRSRPWPVMAGAEPLLSGLRQAAQDTRCAAVLLYVNSPGGSALASERVADELLRVAQRKPVVAYTDRVSASGGYLASLGAGEIWAGPHSVVGSIGVFAGKFDAQTLLERLGIQRTAFTRGEHAGLATSTRALSPTERSALELDVEETYQRFVARVARSRKLSVPEVLARAEGRVFTAAARWPRDWSTGWAPSKKPPHGRWSWPERPARASLFASTAFLGRVSVWRACFRNGHRSSLSGGRGLPEKGSVAPKLLRPRGESVPLGNAG